MRNFINGALAVALLALICHVSIVYASKRCGLEEIQRLSAENERLRAFNARRERRLKWMREPEKINLQAVQTASHVLGTPPSVVAALLYSENGPQDLETGSIDKTDIFAKVFPIQYWSTLDGVRTLNRLAWTWFLETESGREALPRMLKYAAKPYTALSDAEQRVWMKNMVENEKRMKEKLETEKDKPTVYAMRTPTPNRRK